MTFVSRVLSHNRVTIPQKFMDIMKSKEGDVVIVEFRTAPIGVLIRPAEVMPREAGIESVGKEIQALARTTPRLKLKKSVMTQSVSELIGRSEKESSHKG